jgi:D-tyrosyl-tRNA(Tyr) deacylase
MRALIQRVSHARVTVEGSTTGQIGAGLLVLAGFAAGDTSEVLETVARKLVQLRLFRDDADKMNLSLADINGEILVVSQFTLYADCRKGRRPGFTNAAPPAKGRALYEEFLGILRRLGHAPQTGMFGAMMKVELLNDGPVTIMLDSDDLMPAGGWRSTHSSLACLDSSES